MLTGVNVTKPKKDSTKGGKYWIHLSGAHKTSNRKIACSTSEEREKWISALEHAKDFVGRKKPTDGVQQDTSGSTHKDISKSTSKRLVISNSDKGSPKRKSTDSDPKPVAPSKSSRSSSSRTSHSLSGSVSSKSTSKSNDSAPHSHKSDVSSFESESPETIETDETGSGDASSSAS